MNAKEYLEEYKTLKGNAEEMQQTYDYLISKAEYRNSVIDGMPRSQSHENTQENILVQASVTKDKLLFDFKDYEIYEGSKRIPRKNVRIMCGKPLIAYSIENAKSLKEFLDVDVAVSTDDEELGSIVEKRGVEVIRRPAELATDKVTLDPVIYHAVNYMEDKNDKKL